MVDQQALLDQLDDMEEVGGGLGVWCQALYFCGFKSFANDLDQDDSLATFDPGSSKDLDAAKAKVVEVLENNSIDYKMPKNRPARVVGFTLFRDTVFGRAWENDITKVVATYWDAYSELVKPALSELIKEKKLTGWDQKYWSHFVLLPDPSGRTEEDEEGEERPRMVWVPDEIYASEKEMIAAAEAAGAGQDEGEGASAEGEGEKFPPDYSAELWDQFQPEIAKKRDAIVEAGGPPPAVNKSMEALGEEYGISVDWVKEAVA